MPFPFALRKGHRVVDPDTECTLVASMPEAEPQLVGRVCRRRTGAVTAGTASARTRPGIIAKSRRKFAVPRRGGQHGPDGGGRPGEGAIPLGRRITRRSRMGRTTRPDRGAENDLRSNPVRCRGGQDRMGDQDPARNRSLTNALARFPLHSALLLDAKFAMATSGAHVLARWRTTGGGGGPGSSNPLSG